MCACGRPLNATQLQSLVSTVRWTIELAAKGVVDVWAALLLLRADLELKGVVRLPAPARSGCDLLLPFQTLDGHGVADTILYVPWCRVNELLRTLLRRAATVTPRASDGGPSHVDHLHRLCSWLSDVRYLLPLMYDANTMRDNNPLYRMVGRPEREKGAVEKLLREKRGAVRPRNRAGVCRHNRSVPGFCHRGCVGPAVLLARQADTPDGTAF